MAKMVNQRTRDSLARGFTPHFTSKTKDLTLDGEKTV